MENLCYACDGPGVYTGSLGDIVHFRCRDCGAEYSMHHHDLPSWENEEGLNAGDC